MEYNFKMIFIQIKNNYIIIIKKYIEKIDIYKICFEYMCICIIYKKNSIIKIHNSMNRIY